MKHTPGPWIHDDGAIVAEQGGAHIALLPDVQDFPCADDDDEASFKAELNANARLIAAAPELLEACKVALESLRAWNSMSTPREMRALSERTYEQSPEIKGLVAAIAKAEGE